MRSWSQAGSDYSPTTANGWLAILRVIMKTAKRELGLGHLATEGVLDFNTSEHITYTEEQPNALSPDMVPTFLGTVLDMYPQHYGMTYLGLTSHRSPAINPATATSPWDDA